MGGLILVQLQRCDIQWVDLREPPFDHVLNVGGDHCLFLGFPLSGYKDSMQGLSVWIGCVCVFASKVFGLWRLRFCLLLDPNPRSWFLADPHSGPTGEACPPVPGTPGVRGGGSNYDPNGSLGS